MFIQRERGGWGGSIRDVVGEALKPGKFLVYCHKISIVFLIW